MMEPDCRIESNSKGYCRRHFEQMYQKPNKLQLALVLETHLDEIRKKLSVFEKDVSSLKGQKTSFFKKSGAQELCEKTASHLHQVNSSCMICDKINHTMERYIDVLLYLWINDPNFQKKFENSKGLCLPHMEKVCSQAAKTLKDSQAAAFLEALFKKQLAEFSRMQEEIHHFTLKFDYRNQDMLWGNAKDSPERLSQKISGSWNKSEKEK